VSRLEEPTPIVSPQAGVHVDGGLWFFGRPRQKDSEGGYGLSFFPESRVLIALVIIAPFLVS